MISKVISFHAVVSSVLFWLILTKWFKLTSVIGNSVSFCVDFFLQSHSGMLQISQTIFRKFAFQFKLTNCILQFMNLFNQPRILELISALFYNVKNWSSNVTSTSSSKNLSDGEVLPDNWHFNSCFVLKTTKTPLFFFITEILWRNFFYVIID